MVEPVGSDLGHYERLVRMEREGSLAIGVSRVFAKHLYLQVPAREFFDKAGDYPQIHKAVVFSVWIAGPIFLFGSLALLIMALTWWSLAAGPVAVLIWIFYRAMSRKGSANTLWVSMLLHRCSVKPSDLIEEEGGSERATSSVLIGL